jgi:peptidoglycan hydrolase-like protein with peptidoglycan-binding domain
MIDITQDDVVTWEKYRDFYKELPYMWANEVKRFPLLFGGCAGPYVKILQKYLGIAEDGHFGTDTEVAVKLYQKRRQLEVDGKVGRQTWASFFV